ncbi:hypothetical protein [Actinoplanes auranticolor]|uniref:Integral membrane protein n=1 Tax=Actinoplanes auranticolor TaxID=47988 RepID=A0A919SWU3_9ACTN|nr:hypothetical protein [Actinoplanes auranticolor]GIM79805.1 hypothetical protein Aau02nite_87570 [Actinoplanes auranticolor]
MTLQRIRVSRARGWLSSASRADIVAALVALALIGVAALVGGLLYLAGRPVQASAAPFYAHWLPHLGPGTPLALTVAGLVVWHGQALAARLSWRSLLAAAYGTAVAWTLSLALVDGWQRGLAGRLTTEPEYLHEVSGVTDVSEMVRGFAARILDFQPESWTTHVSGHPPGALLVFVGLDRIGLGGGGWAAVVCVLVGAAAAVAVPETVRLLAAVRHSEATEAARAAVPFAVLFPGAVWVGASADGLFAGVAAVGVMLLARGLTRRAPVAAFIGGVLLAFALYLSYGLALLAPIVLAVVFLARRWRPLVLAALGGGVVVALFTASGFWWWDGYHLVVERYYQGVASDRSYGYWVWANLAALSASAGLAVAPILRRAVLARPVTAERLLPIAALVAVVAADLSGLSKAEVERIWLPFAVWFAAGAALLPLRSRRGWLVVQALTALLVNHLLLTSW